MSGRRPRGRVACRLITICVLLIAPCVGLSSCGSVAGGKSFDQAVQDSMRSAVDDVMRSTAAPGAVVGVWTPKGTWTYAAGKADLRTSRRMETGDMVAIGSITKTFVATVVLQLAQEKRLSLDDALSKYNTQISNASSIKVRDLLDHTSGIYDYWEDDSFLRTVASDPEKEWTPREEVAVAAKHAAYFAPGQGWHYSSTNYTLLGIIVEKVTANTLGNEINSRVAGELGLKNTYLSAITMVEGPETERAHGYIAEDEDGTDLVDVTDTNPSCYWAAGAMASDLSDMGVYIEALATGEMLTRDMQEERLTWVNTKKTVGELAASYGLGIYKVGAFLGHSGGVLGYSTAAYYLPSEDATFFACITKHPTQDGTADKVVQDIARILYPTEFP